jgi:hypothetical protein
MDAVIESLGWAGAVIVLGGYLLFSAGKIPNGPLYQVFNLVGALFVCVNVCAHQAWPSTIVNGIWAIIAAVVLVRMWTKHRAAKRAGEAPAEPEQHIELPTTTAVLPVIGPALTHEQPAHDQPALDQAHEQPVSIADSVPVITAALAIVAAAAQEHAAQEHAAQEHAAADSRTIDA